MCGIVGILGKAAVAEQLVDALRRLNIAVNVADRDAREWPHRAPARRRRAVQPRALPFAGAAFRRNRHRAYALGDAWPPDARSTRIRTPTEKLAVVHNGIIENFRELESELETAGIRC